MVATITIIRILLYIAGLIAICFNYDGSLCALISIFLLSINTCSLIRVRQNYYLFIIFACILYSNYSICMANYVLNFESFFLGFKGFYLSIQALNILFLFNALLDLIVPNIKIVNKNKILPIVKNNKYNALIEIILSTILVYILIFCFIRPDIEGVRGSPNQLYEYSIIFIILSFYYSGNSKFWQGIFITVSLMFALQNFIYGGRITGLQIIICLFLCLYVNKISNIFVGVFVLIGMFIMFGIGIFRVSFSFSSDTLSTIISNITNNYFILDTAYSSYYTSLTFVDLLNNVDISDRLYLFFKWVLSMFLGGSNVVDSNLATYTRQYYFHYFGGILPFFAYFYLGYIGIAFLILYIKFLFQIASLNNNNLFRIVSIYFVTTTFRWYLYSPSQMFRGVFLLFVVYCLCEQLNRITGNLWIKKF